MKRIGTVLVGLACIGAFGCEKCSGDKTAGSQDGAASLSATSTSADAGASTQDQSDQSDAALDTGTADSGTAGTATSTAAGTDTGKKEKVEITDLKGGKGAAAEVGKKLTVIFLGKVENGAVFDTHLDKSSPFTFILGSNMVLPCWEQGLAGMKLGGRRKLTCPASLAYGSKGVANVIPPNARVVFEITLLKVE